MLVVVDASVLVDLVVEERLAARIEDFDLQAPVTVDAEFVHALRRKWLAGLMREEAGVAAMTLFDSYAITRHPIATFKERMWALRQNLTAYDAAYVALAEMLRAPLITRDRRLSRSSGHAARIEYID